MKNACVRPLNSSTSSFLKDWSSSFILKAYLGDFQGLLLKFPHADVGYTFHFIVIRLIFDLNMLKKVIKSLC